VRHLPQVATVITVLVILFSFVGCSSYFEPVAFNRGPSGKAVDLGSGEVNPNLMRPTTLYGLLLIALIVVIGIGLWFWEIKTEGRERPPYNVTRKRKLRSKR
jgi:hypothetical protein